MLLTVYCHVRPLSGTLRGANSFYMAQAGSTMLVLIVASWVIKAIDLIQIQFIVM